MVLVMVGTVLFLVLIRLLEDLKTEDCFIFIFISILQQLHMIKKFSAFSQITGLAMALRKCFQDTKIWSHKLD